MHDQVEIRVRGDISESAERLFAGFAHSVEPVTTTLRGEVGDEEELAALVRRIRDAGIELVSLRRLPAPGEAAAATLAEPGVDSAT